MIAHELHLLPWDMENLRAGELDMVVGWRDELVRRARERKVT